MTEIVFNLTNSLILPFWFLMILLPGWRWTRRIMSSMWPIVVLAAAYGGLLLFQIGSTEGAETLLDPTLEGIAALLGTPAGAAIGWAHFLAFDLFVGRWAYLDSRQRGISAWLASPALFFILMTGPLGLLLYLGVRWISGRRAGTGLTVTA